MLTCLCWFAGTVATVDCCFSTFLNIQTQLLAAWQELLQYCHHCTTTLLPFCLACTGFDAVSTWLIVFLFIFINLGSLAVWQAVAMLLMQCCCHWCSFDVAYCCLLHGNTCCQHHYYNIMMLFPSGNHQADACCLVSWLLGLSLGAAAIISNAAAWCCCCSLSPLLAIVIYIPISGTLPSISITLLSIAITVAFHHHHSCCPLPSPLPSIAITATITINNCQLLPSLLTTNHCHICHHQFIITLSFVACCMCSFFSHCHCSSLSSSWIVVAACCCAQRHSSKIQEVYEYDKNHNSAINKILYTLCVQLYEKDIVSYKSGYDFHHHFCGTRGYDQVREKDLPQFEFVG